MRVRGLRISISSSRPKDPVAKVVSNTTMGYPTAMAEVRNSSGRMGVYQRGWTLVGAISRSEPSPDWCKQERTTPKMMRAGMIFSRK